ncbi:MAG: hypothetical protein Q8K93_00020 [Reyranella sp.]|uniref:hypothetical protein n=1 Tax=Reyranella sp. TaxID=1929291 RepID=UPI002731F81C|nr:hypothetical protein [Reyranella sp.]MDP1960560.1 hypothetical protein [Reyranella sp.]MDP2372061.1 hypothetical protein [Reyranella sp.]
MTIAADIKRATAELRERDPRWFVVKRLILIRPITHWMHGVYLRPSNWTKGGFYLHPVARILAVPARKPSVPMSGWNVSVPDSHDASSWKLAWPKCGEVLADVVLNKLLPEIEATKTPDGMSSYLKRAAFTSTIAEHGAFSYALAGRRPEALELARSIVPPGTFGWDDEKSRRNCERLMRVLKRGQGATNGAFRRLERLSARNFGVEKWWRWEPLVDT